MASKQEQSNVMRAERILANEKMFEAANNQVAHYIDSIVPDDIADVELNLYCECADPTCEEKIAINHRERKNIKKIDDLIFIVVPGHYFPGLEDVLKRFPEYWVIHKQRGKIAHVKQDHTEYKRADGKEPPNLPPDL
jgi:hypothetical protein